MSKLSLPAFTAESSLYKTSERYHMVMMSDEFRQEIIPQTKLGTVGACTCEGNYCCCCDEDQCTCGWL